MTPAGADPFPQRIRVIRQRRRTVELGLEDGALVARAPLRLPRRELEPMLERLRAELWATLQRRRVFDDEALRRRAEAIRRRHLSDLRLPPYTVRFSRRQRRRWASCIHGGGEGRIHVSDRLRGHPNWVLEHVLLHELIHLLHPDHREGFRRLLQRDPHAERARGYMEALESQEQIGAEVLVESPAPAASVEELPLFESAPTQLGSEPSASRAREEPSPPSDEV